MGRSENKWQKNVLDGLKNKWQNILHKMPIFVFDLPLYM
jgi:hypothetical protein